MKTIIIGMGEIGSALHRVLKPAYPNVDAYDTKNPDCCTRGTFEIMHICIPYSDTFIESVRTYQELYKPRFTVIHSTVPVGTSRTLNALHSPCRGQHPFLEEGIRTFPKFIGGEQASLLADYFRRAGLKVILCDTQEETELGKILDTEYYRSCIEFAKRAKELADKYNVPFHTSYTLFNQTYNEGYKALGRPEYMRPVLQPIMTDIAGHCVMPNSKML